MSPHAKGILIATLGVIAISPDTLLIRMVDLDYGATLFWRSLFTSLGLILLIVCTKRGDSFATVKKLGRSGLLVTVLFSISNLAFLSAIHLTTVANTLVIISTAPVFAALMGRIFLGEPITGRTWIATSIVMAAIYYIFSQDIQGPTSWGNLGALASAIALSATFVVTRRQKDIDMTPAMAGSALLSLVIAVPFVTSFAITLETLGLLALLGLFLTAAFTLLFIAPRYVPATEVSLLMPLETILGTFLVWVVIGEEPSARVIIGGIIIISVLTLNSLYGIRENRTP